MNKSLLSPSKRSSITASKDYEVRDQGAYACLQIPQVPSVKRRMGDLNVSNRGPTNITECTGTVDDTITQRRYSEHQSILTTRDRLTRHAVPRNTVPKQNPFEKLPAKGNRTRLISDYEPFSKLGAMNAEGAVGKSDELYYQCSSS